MHVYCMHLIHFGTLEPDVEKDSLQDVWNQLCWSRSQQELQCWLVQ